MKQESKKQNIQSGGPVYRVRMIYKEGKYSIKKVVPVEKMNLLKSLELPKAETHVGSYVELKSRNNEVIYRTHYEDPSDPYVMVSNEDGTFSHLKSNLKEKHFEILIPDVQKGHSLHFLNSADGKNYCEEVHKITIATIRKSINPKNKRK